MVTEPQKIRKSTIVRHICSQVRSLLAAGELSPVEIAQVLGCPVSTVYTVRARTNRAGRAAWVQQQFVALERRIANVERLVGTANERISALERRPAKTGR
jgi:hypothetical protein